MDLVRELREWQPLADLLAKIPARAARHNLLFGGHDLQLTCVAAVPEFVAVGTDAGLVFWYNRQTGDMQRLRCESTSPITCLHVVSSVEFMVAAGNTGGQLNVFQIQKEHPADLELDIPLTQPRPIERYVIGDMHGGASVRCVRWAKNGMKLFSGDERGAVVLSEFDYQLHISKSSEILNESYEIVQIDFRQPHLLVTTSYRAIVCDRQPDTGNWRVQQIGTKDRKVLSAFGAAFLVDDHHPGSQAPAIICARPGFRFWVASASDGAVQQTILFKDAMERLNQSTFEVPLLNPGRSQHTRPAGQFGPVHMFGADVLVTHSGHCVYFLHLRQQKVIGTVRRLRGIVGLCVTADGELFVLEGDRSLVRIARWPDGERPPANGHRAGPLEFQQDAGPLVDDATAEECFELPPIEAIELDTPLRTAFDEHDLPAQDRRVLEHSRKVERFERIDVSAYDPAILFKARVGACGASKRSRSQAKVKLAATPSGIVEIGQQAAVVEEKKRMAATVSATVAQRDTMASQQSSSSSIPKAILHTVRPPTTEPRSPSIVADSTLHLTTTATAAAAASPFQSPTKFPPYVLDCPVERTEPSVTNLSDDMKNKRQTEALQLVRIPPAANNSSAAINIVVTPGELRPMPAYMNVPNLWNMEIMRLPAGGEPERSSNGGDEATATTGEQPLSLSSETSSFEIVDMYE